MMGMFRMTIGDCIAARGETVLNVPATVSPCRHLREGTQGCATGGARTTLV